MKLFLILYATLFLVGCTNKIQVSDNSIRKGLHFIDQEDYQKAIEHFQSLLTKEIDDESKAIIYRNISIAFQNLEYFDSSLYYAKKSYIEAPDDSFEYYLNKADYELLKNHISEAIFNLDKAKAIEPQRYEVYNRFCSVYSGEYNEVYFNPKLAEENALIACKIKPGRIVKEQLGAIYFQNEKYEQSAKIFKELVNKFPSNKKYTFYLGQAIYFNGNEVKGMKLMMDAAERDDSCKVMFQEIFQNK